MVRTAWADDRWARGAYSYLPVGSDPAMRRALAEPLVDRVFFAGEATATDHPATVHGALRSGMRTAEEVRAVAGGSERVLVVGAGVAGLAAAAALRGHGHDMQVLEARDRIGGRVDTVRPDGWPIAVERGASWIHDVASNDLRDRTRRIGIDTVGFEYRQAVLDPGVGRVEDVEGLLLQGELAVARAVAWADRQDHDLSLATALSRSEVAGEDAGRQVVEWYLGTEITTESAADAEELSAWWGVAEGSEGDDLLVTGGYDRIAADLAAGLDVQLRQPVVRVAWGETGALVTTDDGVVHEADRLVLTVPLGVLKAGEPAFDPPLPQEKRTAIESLGMGTLDKYWFRFGEQFWTEEAQMWTTMDGRGSPFTEWFNLAPSTGAPVLLALLGGPSARQWEQHEDAAIEAAAASALDSFLFAGW
jgi:monoamine oxidase